jgi:hypothetical protein
MSYTSAATKIRAFHALLLTEMERLRAKLEGVEAAIAVVEQAERLEQQSQNIAAKAATPLEEAEARRGSPAQEQGA